MEFHISRAVREAAQVDDLLFSYSGNVIFANVSASRKLAEALNSARGKDPARGPNADPAGAYNAGALFAMGLIDELSHALVARYRTEIDPSVLTEAVRWFAAQIQPEKLEALLLAFTEQFPNVAVFRKQLTAAQWLAGTTEGIPNREVALEELLLLWIANLNPAFKPFQTLFEDAGLKQQTAYTNVTSAFPDYFATRPPVSPEVGSLFEALRAPALASPDSLTGQLDFIREHWTPYLGEDIKRILLAIDVLREEDLAIWMRFHPPGPDQYRHGAPTWGSQGFVGDEFIGYEEELRSRKRYQDGYQAPLDEYEAFSADQAWMPNVVLMAKSTYVWLEQLSKKYQRHIHRLDHIPDEELRLLAERGITGLWLIGLWERSVASQTIKHLRGHADAVASAYSLKSYDIAADLGGWAAYEDLKHRAAAAGLRLASDMVPNHMGIDSPWVIEHPDWFINRWESPFPAYSFNGPDLSTDSRVEIKLDDHYYDQTDAAVAFRLRTHSTGETRYIYHGNDGTTFAWNDTAQLDYSKAYVREHVIQTILHVARLFPIIRFDAAMVLAKRHVQRLWFPLPGAGGSIPSRAENSMSQEDFDALMPAEFWREVVDRVAVEVPGTLLLAEAFWMLEGYFVRTLGMHRVYNSAFMNMLRDEENAKYRSYLKKTIEFDPDIMKRYVNFMSNPDERTAIDQFGSGDKCFGVATLMCTLPGLPMFGHGQIEGFTERYGMEFKQAKMDEWPNEHLVARHQREIAPLLKKRYIFAGSSDFTLYDFWNNHGAVDENVFAYSNRFHDERSLVLYNNKYDATSGTIHISAAFMDKATGNLRQRTLSEGLALPAAESLVILYRDTHGLEYLRRATDIQHHGLTFSLNGFQSIVLLGWHELWPTTEWPWDRLCDALHGRGVRSAHDEMTRLRLAPLHDALRAVITSANIQALATLATELAAPANPSTNLDPATDPGPPFMARSDRDMNGSASSELPSASALDAPNATTPSLLSFDPRIAIIVGRSQALLQRIQELAPNETNTTPPEKTQPSSKTAKPVATPEQTYAETLTRDLLAAAALPSLATSYTADWPAKSRPILPLNTPATSTERTWAPILAFVILRALPPSIAAPSVELFDQLLFRHVLAEIFASLGLEGEAAWQAAAQVRLLLSAESTIPNAIQSTKLWSNPDVRWLAGTNTADGIDYVNQQQFEELQTWLQLPSLLEIAQPTPITDNATRTTKLTAIETSVPATSKAAASAGYKLESFLTPTKPTPASIFESPKKTGKQL